MSSQHSLLHRLLFNPTYAAGLDIQDRLLRLAHVQPGKENLTALHEHPLPEGVVENGEIIDEREFARNLADALRASGIKNTYYVTHPPMQHTAIRLLAFPPMPTKELRSAVRYEAGKSLPYALADAAISFAPIEQGKPKKAKAKKPRRGKRRNDAPEEGDPMPQATEAKAAPPEEKKERGRGVRGGGPRAFVVAATPNAHVLKLMRVAKTAGVRLGIIEPRVIATLRALQHHQLISPDEMVLDIGEHYANLTVVIDHAVHLARNLPYAARDLANGKQSAVDGFNRDIIATLEYVPRIKDTLLIQRLVVIGGELHPTITTALEGLNLSIQTPQPPEERLIGPALTAYGLALRGARGV